MIQRLQIEGVERTVMNLAKIRQRLFLAVRRDIITFGDRVVTELKKKHKDLTITGQFFEKNMEYWIIISRLGRELTWIKCPTSNLFYTKKRNPDGSQDFRSDVKELGASQTELDIDKLVKRIAIELSNKIRKDFQEILK